MAFYSTATNLVPGVTNVGEIYVRDVVAGTTVWASAYARTALQLPSLAHRQPFVRPFHQCRWPVCYL